MKDKDEIKTLASMIIILATAILEQQKYGRLSPQTVEILKKIQK